MRRHPFSFRRLSLSLVCMDSLLALFRVASSRCATSTLIPCRDGNSDQGEVVAQTSALSICAAIAAAATAGSSASMIGRPTTRKSAPAATALAGVDGLA